MMILSCCWCILHILHFLVCQTVFFPKNPFTPIYKAGDKCDVGNYRPISFLPVLSRILEPAVHDQLHNYLTCNNILHQCQSGFRNNHSTHTALLDVTDHILKNTNDGTVTASIFLDLKKAFDTVSHNLLSRKLDSYGINGKSLNWFKSCLSRGLIECKQSI